MNDGTNLGRRLAVYGPGLILLALLQLVSSLDERFFQPDYLLLFPILAALWTPGKDIFVLGVAAGFIRDYAAGRGYGPGMLFGMIFSLCANSVARNGWTNYAIRGSLLVLGATLVNRLTMAILAWLIPLDYRFSTLATVIKRSLARTPSALLANLGGALLISAYFWLAFRRRGTFEKEAERAVGAKEGGHE